MASRRDQLRAMSKKNLETHQQTTLQPTLVTDVVNQLNTVSSETNEDTKHIIEQIPTPSEQLKIENIVTEPQVSPIIASENIQETIIEPIQETKTAMKTEQIPENESITEKTEVPNSENTTTTSLQETIKEPTTKKKSTLKTNHTSSKKEKIKESNSTNTEKYTGREITVTLLVSEEVAEFLFVKSIELGIPAKKYFKNLIVNEIENGVPIDDALAKSYRKTQHDTIKKSIPINEDLKAVIKQTAMKYHMRYTAFMAYVLDKARLAE